MLFAASRPEVQSILGLQEQNQICLQSNPPKCFDIGDSFDTSLDTGSPYQTPSRKDLEDEMKPGEGGPPSDFNIQDFLVPVKKADVKLFDDEGYQLVEGKRAEDWFNEGTGIEKGGYENAPQWLRDQLWKQDLRRRQELGLEPVAY